MSEKDPLLQGDILETDNYGAFDNIGRVQVQETITVDNIYTRQHSVEDSDHLTVVYHSQTAEQEHVTEGDILETENYGSIDNIGRDQVQETITVEIIYTRQHSVADSDHRTVGHHSQPAEQENVTYDGGCTNPGHLNRVLCDVYSSMVSESEERLKNNCNSIGLEFGISTPRNGNCFFEAVSAQLKRIGLVQWMQMTASDLRQRLVEHIQQNTNIQSPDNQVQIDRFQSYRENLRQESVFADHEVAVETARMLKADIVIVTSCPNTSPEQFVTWIVGKSDFSGDPLLLGHCWENHYQSLEPTKKTNPIQIWRNKLVSKMTEEVMKVERCTDPAILETITRSMANESVKRLEENCNSAGLTFGTDISKNGNCFFEAISAQLMRLRLPRKTATELRQQVVEYISNDRESQSCNGPFDWENWSTEMMREDVFADHIAVFGTAKMLQVDIVIVTSAPNSNPRQSVTWIVGDPNFSGDPLLLGYCWQNQYKSLEPESEGCSNPGHLKSILCDASVKTESEKLLRQNCSLLGLQLSTSKPKNGNCFFEAVAAQLPQEKRMTASTLRNNVVQHLSKNRNFQSPDGEHNVEYFLSEPLQSWCEKMNQERVFADHIVVVGTAQMLQMDIVIVTSSPNINPEQFVTWIVGKTDFSGAPLLLGHCLENYYLCLEPVGGSRRGQISTKELVSEMRRNAIKEINKNIRQFSTRHRTYERISYAIKDVGCTNPGHLESILRDLSVLNESEKRLRQHCRSVGLKFGISTPRNGNDFFEAVSDQLKRLCLPQDMQMTASELRQKVVGYLSQNQHFQSLDGSIDIEYFLSKPFRTWCKNMRTEGVLADHIVAVGTAQMLKMDIVIVTSSPNINPEQFVTWIVGEPNFSGTPLLLGHCWENHYLSLEPVGGSRRGHISTKELVSEMRRNAIKGRFTCTCHEEIRLDINEIDTLQEGDHITRPLKCCCGYIHLCFHHAILKAKIQKVKPDKGKTQEENPGNKGDVIFPFIGFAESNETKAEITSEEEILNYNKMYIYKIDYKYPKYEGEQVIKNVEQAMGNDIPYHVFLNNCEHVCRSCVVGEEKSNQVETLDKCCAQSVFGCLPRLVRLVLAILSTIVDEFYSTNNGWIIGLQSFALTVYFYLTLRQFVSSQFQYDSKKMCKKCLQKSYRNFLLGLVFIILSVIGIIVDAAENKCVTLALALVTLSFWFIVEVCNTCSKRCRQIATRCICFCTICTCCYRNEWCIANCCPCCKCKRCFKCCRSLMENVDELCYIILKSFWSGSKWCCSRLQSGCAFVYTVLRLLFFNCCPLPCCKKKISDKVQSLA